MNGSLGQHDWPMPWRNNVRPTSPWSPTEPTRVMQWRVSITTTPWLGQISDQCVLIVTHVLSAAGTTSGPEQSTESSPPEKANITYALRYSEAPPDVADVVIEDP